MSGLNREASNDSSYGGNHGNTGGNDGNTGNYDRRLQHQINLALVAGGNNGNTGGNDGSAGFNNGGDNGSTGGSDVAPGFHNHELYQPQPGGTFTTSHVQPGASRDTNNSISTDHRKAAGPWGCECRAVSVGLCECGAV